MSAKMIDWTEKPKIPLNFAKRAAWYKELGYNLGLLTVKRFLNDYLRGITVRAVSGFSRSIASGLEKPLLAGYRVIWNLLQNKGWPFNTGLISFTVILEM